METEKIEFASREAGSSEISDTISFESVKTILFLDTKNSFSAITNKEPLYCLLQSTMGGRRIKNKLLKNLLLV